MRRRAVNLITIALLALAYGAVMFHQGARAAASEATFRIERVTVDPRVPVPT